MPAEQEFYLASPPLSENELTRRLLAAERVQIDRRREVMKRRAATVGGGDCGDRTQAPLTGLALSGGGIRSASLCLGALQALNQDAGVAGIDYLSTVSGGGYIGSCLTACLDRSDGAFPFARNGDFGDTDAVRHIRDFSRYLIPSGMSDIVVSAAIFLRGLLANIVLLAPFMFGAVWLTLKCHPDVEGLDTPKILWWDSWTFLPQSLAWLPGGLTPLWSSPGFYVTQILLLFTLPATLLWAFMKSLWTSSLWRAFKDSEFWRAVCEPSWRGLRQLVRKIVWIVTFGRWSIEGSAEDFDNPGDRSDELRGLFPFFLQLLFGMTVVSALFELQPFILQRMPSLWSLDLATAARAPSAAISVIYDWLTGLAPKLAPLGAALAFLSKFLFNFEKLAQRSSKGWVRVLTIFPSAALWFVGLVIPSFLWYGYLELCEIGLLGVSDEPNALFAPIVSWSQAAADVSLPQWIAAPLARPLAGLLDFVSPSRMARLYFAAFAFSLLLALFINPNATSFFRLYRDRLNKAFVFDPDFRKRDSRNDLRGVSLKLHELKTDVCPYPLINVALNLEGSQFANKRGRNADFFLFSKLYSGSMATGYVDSASLWREERDLDLATAMAISGAAISANMGAATIKPLVATLALLNVRLGYWLRNPRKISAKSRTSLVASQLLDGAKRSFLLFLEVFGLIDETSGNIYLTDGGNVENLGLYELLRRRCKVIIAIDAEADPGLDFPSLITLERYARIDLGVLINVPWGEIRERSLAVDKEYAEAAAGGAPVKRKNGPHCAVCEIVYSASKEDGGLLFYFKSSLSGDENDVVSDYKRKHPAFPHETTIDQFFGEHQLEAYRALGFHIVHEILDENLPDKIRNNEKSTPDFAIRQRPGDATIEDTKIAALIELRAALVGRPIPPSGDIRLT